MSAAKHTPGPWEVTSQATVGRYIVVRGATQRTVARVPFSTQAAGDAGTATDAADAALIAAAPDLFAALRAMAEDDSARNCVGTLVHDAALAAIARAEGRS